jgi:hypothetical protein
MLGRIVAELQSLQNRFFPPNLDRKRKAELLLEFEECYHRRMQLIQELDVYAENLDVFAFTIRDSIEQNAFKARESNSSTKQRFAVLDNLVVDHYASIKDKAIECERLAFKLFTLRQKLKLYGIDSSIKGWEDGVLS